MIGSKKLFVLAMIVVGLGVASVVTAITWHQDTEITSVTITSHSNGDIVFAGEEYTVTCSTSTDSDLSCESHPESPTNDPVTHTWSGDGSFSPTTGTSVTWTAPIATGTATITVTADDSPLFDDTATTATITLNVTKTILRVDINVAAGGNDDGSTWANAYEYLQDALAAAETANDYIEIWVAEGTYFPDDGTDRTKSFELVDGVEVYGGFEGIAAEDERGDRDWFANETILSGDIDDDGSLLDGDNSYHVVKGADTAILDGFTITGGYADGSGNDAHGGGILNLEPDLIISHCIIKDNYATGNGGGLYNAGSIGDISTLDVTNCLIIDNDATDGAGAYLAGYTDTSIENCTVSNNKATSDAGGVYNYSATCETDIVNSILWGDSDSDDLDYEIVSDAADVEIIYSNYGNVATVSSGTFTYTGINSSLEPRFVGSGDYHLKSAATNGRYNGSTWVSDSETSICIDGGDSTSDYSNEPSDDGDRVNQGYYGNTAEASKYLEVFDVVTFMNRVYVDGDYTGSGYGTESQPYKTITAGIFYVLNGGAVFVNQHTYEPFTDNDPGLSFDDSDTGFSLVGIPDSLGDKPIIHVDLTQSPDWGQAIYFKNCTNDFVIDGFIIEGGNPIETKNELSHLWRVRGGGIHIFNSSPTIKNCVIRDNTIERQISSAAWGGQGAGMYIKDGDPIIFNCEFYGNEIDPYTTDYEENKGGAIYTKDSEATFSYCTIGSTTNPNNAETNRSPEPSWASHEVYTAVEHTTKVPTYDHCKIHGGFNGTRMHNDTGYEPDDGGGNTGL